MRYMNNTLNRSVKEILADTSRVVRPRPESLCYIGDANRRRVFKVRRGYGGF